MVPIIMPIATGDKIKITQMVGEPQYSGKEGIITNIDSIGQIQGTWGEYALVLGKDQFIIIQKKEENV